MKQRERLTLASLKIAVPSPSPAPAKPAPAAKRSGRDCIREFSFPDGRPITLHRDTIRFAAPLKTDPEHACLVASKDGASPMPLMVRYADFVAWWRGSFNGRCKDPSP
jgi:hypothetical protein